MAENPLVQYPIEKLQAALERATQAGDEPAIGALKRAIEQKSEPGALDTAADMGKSLLRGLARGAAGLAGAPGDAAQTLHRGMETGINKLLGTDVQTSHMGGLAPLPFPTTQTLMDMTSMATGGASSARPGTTAGKYSETVGEFLPGAAAFGGANPGNLARFGLLPGVASEAAGQATEGMRFNPSVSPYLGENVEPWARGAAALASPGVTKAVTPNPITDPRRAARIGMLEQEGIPMTAGQKVNSPGLISREAANLGDTAARNQAMEEAFTGAALKRTGAAAAAGRNVIDPKVVQGINKELGDIFDGLAKRNKIAIDRTLVEAVDEAIEGYATLSADARIPGIVSVLPKKMLDAVKSGDGTLSGAQYQEIRSTLGRALSNPPNGAVRQLAMDLRTAVDDAMERTIRTVGNKEDLAAYRQVRKNWRDWMAIQDAATRANAGTAAGRITPAGLDSAVKKQGKAAWLSGDRDLGELAKAGRALPALPSSGTSERLRGALPPGTAGAASGLMGGGLADMLGAGQGGTALAAGAGALTPYAFNRMVMSKPVQQWLGNQALPAEYATMKHPGMLGIAAGLKAGNSR